MFPTKNSIALCVFLFVLIILSSPSIGAPLRGGSESGRLFNDNVVRVAQANQNQPNAPAVPGTAPGSVSPSPTQPPTPPPSVNGVPATVNQGQAPSRSPRPSGMISLNFDDADIYSVAQTVFGEILRVNYVIDQRVRGRVTFRSVAPVSTDQVLPLMEVILRLNGVGVVEENNLYRLVPIGDIAKEPAQVSLGREPEDVPVQGKSIIHIVPLLYTGSSEMIKIITPFITSTAIVIDVPTMNYIIIVDTDANVRRILNIIKVFDSQDSKAKKPQVYVYNILNSKAKEVAAILQQVFGTSTIVMPATTSSTTVTTSSSSTQTGPMQPQIQAQPPRPSTPPVPGTQTAGTGALGSLVSSATKIIADENLNLLVVLALPEDYEIIKEAIAKIDIIPRQVVIEGAIAEVTLTDELRLGVSWALQFESGSFFNRAADGFLGFNSPGSTPITATGTTPATGTGQFTFAGTVGSDLRVIINMLATQGKAKLLAVPHILVSDNKEARIQVGQQVPIVTSESFTTTTATTYSTVQYKDIGIILKVRPRINEGGLVSLDLNQEVSSFSVQNIAGTSNSVVLSKTEAATNLVVQNGQTIVIGGLIREDVSDTREGIPLLSRIPVLGYLFGNTTKINNRTELIILLTPRVIRNQTEAQNITSGYVDTITNTGKGKITEEELLRGQKIVPDQGPAVDNNKQ